MIKEKCIQSKQIYKKNENELVISFMNETSLATTEKILQNKLSNGFGIEVEQLSPKIKIVGMGNYNELNCDKIEKYVNKRNFSNFNSKAQVLITYTNKNSDKDTVIMEVTAKIYKHLRECNNRIFVGYHNCI